MSTNREFDRIPPFNLEAERSVLGSCLIDRDSLLIVIESLRTDDFYDPRHRTAFEIIASMAEQDCAVDSLTFREEVKKRGLEDRLGGLPFVAELMDAVTTTANVEYHVSIVRDKSVHRGLITVGSDISRMGFSEEIGIDEALETAEQKVFEIARTGRSARLKGAREVVSSAIGEIEKRLAGGLEITGVPSGFTDFDKLSGGLQPGSLYILAARPSMGKTAFALNVAQHAALQEDIPVLMFSLEMSAEQIAQRQISAKEFVTAQKAALNSLIRSVKTNYFGWSLAEFLDFQMKSTIFTRLTQEYMVNKYKDIEINDVLTRLQNKLDNIVLSKQEYYNLYPSKFVEDVGKLSKDNFLYYVPQQYQNKYAYVKNLLVQFTEEQKEQLAEYERFGKNSEAYLNFRNQLATELVATDYTSQKDDKGEYTTKIENIFKLVGGEIKLTADTVLSNALNSLPANTDMKLRNTGFDRLIDKYNEDPGMQGKAYDYVLRVDEPDKAGKADSWAKEFSAAGRKAVKEGLGKYEIAVTDFGVHIVYFSGYVAADTFDFEDQNELYTTNTATYRFYRAFYDDVKADIYNERFQVIIDRYFEEGKIKVINKNLKKLLKEYGFKIEWKLD